jgi:hypothetical protein
VEVIRRLGGQWPDREVAVTMIRMRCKPADGHAWTTVRVRELRERLGIAPFDPTLPRAKTVSADEAATPLGSARDPMIPKAHRELAGGEGVVHKRRR